MKRITEEMADKLLENIQASKAELRMLKLSWRSKGLIKQSREKELRVKIKNYENSVCYPNKETTQYEYMCYQKELIEILDNKLKEK
jgi:hypothetical protein